jgi:hypothetical protein
MSGLNKIRTDKLHNVRGKKGMSSYGLLKKKYETCKVELAVLKGVVYETKSQGCMRKKKRKLMKMETTSCYQENEARISSLEDENSGLKATLEQERKQVEQLIDSNEQLDEGNRVCCRVMGELRDKITTLSNANDLLTSKVEEEMNANAILTRKVRQHELGLLWQRRLDRDNEKCVLRAFGWTKLKADPVLLRAACGFWSATVHCTTNCDDTTDIGDARVSLKRRREIWINLTCHGFEGRVMASLEKQFFERKKFNVVEICRKSDVESQFNADPYNQWRIANPAKRNILVACYVVMPLFDGRRRRCINLPSALDFPAYLRKKPEMCGAGEMAKGILRRR